MKLLRTKTRTKGEKQDLDIDEKMIRQRKKEKAYR
jgi:hypothetical protein